MTTPNTDPEEINHFDQLAHDWWDPNGPMATLHHINPLRCRYITDQMVLSNKQLLDVGCGAGLLSESLAKAEAHVVGIDMSQAAIDAARAHAQQKRVLIDYRVNAAEDLLAEYKQHFDAITCMELLEHVPSPQSVLQCCAELLKPGGLLFLSTINRSPFSFLTAIVAAEYLLNIVPRGTHQYAKLIRPSELSCMAEQCGLTLIDLKGMRYNPFTQHAELSPNPRINYLATFAKS